VFIVTASILFGAIFFFGLKRLIARMNQSTTSEATLEIPRVLEEIEKIDTAINNALEYASELVTFDEAIERQEKEKVMKEELNKQISLIATLEGKLDELKLEVEETEKEYNEIKKGKESAREVSDSIKSSKDSLKSENDTLQEGLAEVMNTLKEFSSKTKLNANQEAGFKVITGNIEAANNQLESLVTSYKQSSSRFLNLHEQFDDLEIEFSKLVEQELSD
jgi:predicted nuclease with TOPRIM domain